MKEPMKASLNMMIAAAGTGGHVMPGIAIAKALQAENICVSWLGTTHGMENKILPQQATDLTLHRLNFAGLRGKNILGTVRGAVQLCTATLAAWRILRAEKIAVLVGMGGYVCVPAAFAAWLARVPVVLVNADADVLLSNKVMARFAKTVCCGLPGGTAMALPNAVLTGNPTRAELAQVPDLRGARMTRDVMRRSTLPNLPNLSSQKLSLLVMGGSLGAAAINGVLPLAIAKMPESLRPQIVHQAGAAHVETVQRYYADLNVVATVVPFIADMPAAYAAADLVLCRAGAITVAELCVTATPSILVPLRVSTTSHQVGNARMMAEAGAALMLEQSDMTPPVLCELLLNITTNKSQLQDRAAAAQSLAMPNATQAVVAEILKIVKPQEIQPQEKQSNSTSQSL